MQGKIKFFNIEKGYGFISGDDQDVFLHAKGLSFKPTKGDIVEYKVRKDKKGISAYDVILKSKATTQANSKK